MAQPDAASPRATDGTVTVRARRAPRVGVLLLIGAVIGVIVGFTLVWVIPVTDTALSPRYDRTLMIGPLVVGSGVVGAAITAVIAILLDRRATRRAVNVIAASTVERDPTASGQAARPCGPISRV